MIKTNNFFSFLYHWHQRIGLIIGLAIIAWALSGLAHPIISRLNPTPAQVFPPSEPLQLEQLASIEKLFAQLNISQVNSLRLFQWQDQPVYRITSSRGVDYVNAITLTAIDNGEFLYAEYLARYFSGDATSSIRQISYLSEFDSDYLYINRLLPVVRIDFERADNLSVYVDTAQGRLATMNNNTKQVTSDFFRNFHSWVFIENPWLRKSLMLIFLLFGFSVSLMGLTLYLKSRRLGTFRKEHPPTRRLHRSLGIIVVIPALLFSASGILHLLLVEKSDQPQTQLQHSINTQDITLNNLTLLSNQSIKAIQLTQINNEIVWQVIPAAAPANKQLNINEHNHQEHKQDQQKITNEIMYLDAKKGGVLSNELFNRYLASQLTAFPNEKISKIETISRFTGEYGFINKRLPVEKITYDLPGNPAVYLETSTNTLASLVENPARVEGYSFAYLHKWHFLDFLGKNLRDVITSLFALGIVVLVVLGLYRYIRRPNLLN